MGFLAGATSRSIDFNRIGVNSNDQQVFDFFDHSGFVNQTPLEFRQKRNILGLYGQLNFDVKNMFYVNFAGRNDWVSDANNNSLFYPSASASFIPTSAFPGMKSAKGINYLKLRAGYGTSANFSTGYPTVTLVNLDTQAWVDDLGNLITSNSTDALVGNTDIKPELFSEIEFGVEGKLFSRVNFDVSYYTRETTDLIVDNPPRPIPPSSGASFTVSKICAIEI
jgi:hypothetical protein